MKRSFALASLALFGALAPLSAQITINVAAVDGAEIKFTTSAGPVTQFEFVDGVSGFDFNIISSANLPGLQTLFGNITGTFGVGAITSGPFGSETAPFSGTGVFKIEDGVNDLTANVTFPTGFTVASGGNLNGPISALNLSGFTYAGTNADLIALTAQAQANSALGGQGTLVVSFSFSPSNSLSNLVSTSGSIENWSGIATVIPEPSTYALILTFLTLGFVGYRRIRAGRET